jgi:glycosyltransferase involved in cell wall biosynthesis
MGAPQTRLYELALELKNIGWEVDIVTAMPNYPTGRIFQSHRGKFYVKDNLQGITIHRFWLYPSKSSRVFPRIISMLSFSFTSFFSLFKVRKIRPDYLLVESPPLTLAFTGWLISRLLQIKLIMNVSDLWPLSAKELGAISDGFIYKRLLKLESFLYSKATICTGQSQEIVDYISKIKKNNVWLLRNGVNVSRFERQEERSRSNKIVYAGLLGVAQGILAVCENINFKELDLDFHIYGSGNEVERIQEFISSNSDRGIKYQGVITRDQIPEVLVNYDAMLVVLVKNIYGAVPSKIYEAMAASLPIIFSGEGEGAKIVKQNGLGWTSRSIDWFGLKENLRSLKSISDDKLYTIKVNVRKVASVKFNRKQQVQQFHEALIQSK